MAQQIKKKFIANNAVDGTKIKLLKDQILRGENQASVEVDLLKLDLNDKALILGQEVAYKSDVEDEADLRSQGDADTLQDAKDYADQKVSDLVNSAPAVLDTLKELSDALGGDANFATTIANQIGDLDTRIDNLEATEEVIEAANLAGFPVTGEVSKLYIAKDSNRIYRWSSDTSAYVEISADTDLSGITAQINALVNFSYENTIYVAKNGLDTNLGKQHSPFLTITAALNSITDATPSKRYVVKIASGSYTEASLALKANVFLFGENKEAVRITGNVSLGSSFTAGSSFDNRSGASNLTLLSAADFNWNTVQSAAGKLYFNEVVFGSTLNLYGYNNAIAQAQFNDCIIFGNITISGINVGAFTDNVCFSNITLNQHPNGGMATILAATGGYCSGNITQVASINDFNRRCSTFLRNFSSENLIVNGPAAYADYTIDSGSKQGAQSLNGGNLVPMNAVISHRLAPNVSNTHNMGDWGKQWAWNFGYVHASTGTDLYLISYPESYAPDSAGKSIGIYTDGAGLQANVNGGDIVLETATTSGTGIRGKVQLNGREIDVTSKQIKNLANGSDATDAVNKQQLDAIVQFNKETKTVDSTIISNGYVDLAFEAKPSSIVMFVDRLGLHEGYDYSVSVVGGVTRVTFLSTLLTPSETALEAGDILNFTYAK